MPADPLVSKSTGYFLIALPPDSSRPSIFKDWTIQYSTSTDNSIFGDWTDLVTLNYQQTSHLHLQVRIGLYYRYRYRYKTLMEQSDWSDWVQGGLADNTSTAITTAITDIPPGILADYAGSSAPTGWLLCAGQSLLRTDYPALFTAIGTTYGTVDGTHFTLPDLRGRIPVSLDDMNGSDAGRLTTANTLGGTGGEEKHQLTIAELAGHEHRFGSGGPAGGTAGTNVANTNQVGGFSNQFTTAELWQNTTTQITPTDQAHNNMQPYILMNKIIKT